MSVITSPCIGVCALDPASGLCLGCARSRDEIAFWGGGTPEARAAVWRALPERLDRMGVALRRPDWDEDAIRAALLERFAAGGVWAVGAVGGFVETRAKGAETSVEDGAVVARFAGGALRMRVDRTVRAFTQPGGDGRPDALILAVPSVRLPDPRPAEVAEIGPDRKAIAPEGREEILFDLGLGWASARFMLRTADADLIALLRGLEGATTEELIEAAGAALDAADPTRVAEAFGARAEIEAPLGDAEAGRLALTKALAAMRPAPDWIAVDPANAPVVAHLAAGRERSALS